MLEATHRAVEHHFWFRGFREFVRPLLARASCRITRPRLLDCGCGTGYNLALLAEYGQPFGFDLTWWGLRLATRGGVARANAAQIPFRAASFDVVCCFDVLTCLDDGQEAACLSEIFRLLRPGGAVLVNVAALAILAGELTVVGGERRRYRRRDLQGRLERAGFTIEHLAYTNFALVPLLLVTRTLQRRFGMAVASDGLWDLELPPGLLNRLLGGALALESRLFARCGAPIGSSVLALARKPL